MKLRAKTREKKRSMDWIVVQWARACEERLSPDVAELERAVAVERDERGRLVDPASYIYSRAVETLKLFDAPVERWLERLRRAQIRYCLFDRLRDRSCDLSVECALADRIDF